MQWRRQRRVTHVIGSSNHVLLLARYQDAPPGEEDEEEGLRNGYVKGQQNDTSPHNFDRNGQAEYKPRRSVVGFSGGSGCYASGTSRSRRDESTGSLSQPKIIFNEDEYTRITTPRQDVLFKKGYLSRKKPWASNTSTSATPSTTESQSASHSTADGSETTEDQQLLDRDSAAGEYPSGIDQTAQVGYGTFYDHASGYYYEYPVMLVGPAPVPPQIGPSVLAALPCGSVPLRPIEWINPAFVPKLSGQSYCLMDSNEIHYQSGQNRESHAVVTEEHGNALVPVENSNGVWNENGTGSASCSGSIAGEVEEQQVEETNVIKGGGGGGGGGIIVKEDNRTDEFYSVTTDQCPMIEENNDDGNGAPYLEPIVMQQPPIHHVPHVIPAIPQPYMYPGHYMFGPPLVNVNGVTIQGGPMIRTTDITTMTGSYTKRRKKKKSRKQRRLALVNAEDEEEEYSSEGDNGLSSSSRTSWSTTCPALVTTTITTTMTTTTTTTTATTTMTTTTETATTTTATMVNRPLNPECEEFQFHSVVEPAAVVSPAIPSSPSSQQQQQQQQQAQQQQQHTSEETDQLLRTSTITEGIRENGDDTCRETKYSNTSLKDTNNKEEETTTLNEIHDANMESFVNELSSSPSNKQIDPSTNPENRLTDYLSDNEIEVSSTKEEKEKEKEEKTNTEYVIINDARTESKASQRTDIVNNDVANNSFSANENMTIICERSNSGDVDKFSSLLYAELDKDALTNGEKRPENGDNDDTRNTKISPLENHTLLNEKLISSRSSTSSSPSSPSSSSSSTSSSRLSSQLDLEEEMIVNNNVDDNRQNTKEEEEEEMAISESFDTKGTTTTTTIVFTKNYNSNDTNYSRETTTSLPSPNSNKSNDNPIIERDKGDGDGGGGGGGGDDDGGGDGGLSFDLIDNVDNPQTKKPTLNFELGSASSVVDKDDKNEETEEYDRVSSEFASETARDDHRHHNNHHQNHHTDDKTAVSEDVADGSNDDSGFETQTRRQAGEYHITEAVTEWLRRANSPDVFIKASVIITDSDSSSSSADEEDDFDDEPPKNLKGNPIPALSFNGKADDYDVSSCVANSCSEFAKINNNIGNGKESCNNNDISSSLSLSSSSAISKRRTAVYVRGIKKMSGERLFGRRCVLNKDENILDEAPIFSSSDSFQRREDEEDEEKEEEEKEDHEEEGEQQQQQQQQQQQREEEGDEESNTEKSRNRNLLRKNVAGVCEFTERDSVAGMRVANSSRIYLKRNNNLRRARKIGGRIHHKRRPAESMSVKLRRINDASTEDEGIAEDNNAMKVKTFEKGEIVVTIDGKFLRISPFAQFVRYVENNISKDINRTDEIIDNMKKTIVDTTNKVDRGRETRMDKSKGNSGNEDDDNDEIESTVASLVSIEEPDVLECWEAETIEPIITPKRMLQSHGTSYEGEAAEDDHFQTETAAIVERVQKYYRLARENVTSMEEEEEPYERKTINVLDLKTFNKSGMVVVPNSPVELIKGYQGEDIPIIMPNDKDTNIAEEIMVPIEEAFEVYESCYTDKSPNSIFPSRKTLLNNRQEGEEGPVPCRAVCCSIQ